MPMFPRPGIIEPNSLERNATSSHGPFIGLPGTVIKSTIPKMLEFSKVYTCTKCGHSEEIAADYDQKFKFDKPTRCQRPDGSCNNWNIVPDVEMNPEMCKDYQEIKIQEHVCMQ